MPQQQMKPSTNAGDTKLFTSRGDYVTTVRINPGAYPDVVVWASRCFLRQFGMYREAVVFTSTEEHR